LIGIMAAGLQTKAAVAPTTFRGPLHELSGVGMPHESFSGAWQRNMQANSSPVLLSYSPIYAATTRIAGDIAKMAPELMVDDGTGLLSKAPKNSPFWRVLRKPNSYQTTVQFIRHWMLCKLIFGNAYAIKVREASRGMVVALYLIDPRKVTPVIAPDGGVYYSISGDELSRIPNGIAFAPASEVIHDRGPTLWHPLVGVPPLFAAALSGTLGLSIQRNSAAFFGNMSRPSGVLKAPGSIDDLTYERLKKDWNENYTGERIGKLAILGDGLDFQALTMAAEQSQLAQQLGLTAIDVATAYSLPAYKINQGPMPTSNNVGALNQQYYGDCLQTQMEDIESVLTEGLELTEGYSVQFDIDGLIRMDPAALYDALGKAVAGTVMVPNEARRKAGLPSVIGGDSLWMQQQNYSLEALAKRDAGPDPFGTAKAAAPPPSPAPKPQADGEEEPDDADEKALAADVALIKSGQADLLKRIEELPAPIDADAVREAVAAQLAQSEAKEAERAQATAIAIAEQVKEALAKAMKREEEPEPADVGIFFDALADQLNAEAANG
jgi:HK97 family phage portal protein